MKIYSNGEVIEGGGNSGVTMDQVDAEIDAKLDAYTPLDIYSTEEIRIGTWIDGKPLYQKVINGLIIPSTSSSWQFLAPGVENAEVVAFFSYMLPSSQIVALPSISANGYTQITYINEATSGFNKAGFWAYVTHAGSAGNPLIVILKYTKTTDQATIETQSLLGNKSDNVLSANSIPIQTTATTASAEIEKKEM